VSSLISPLVTWRWTLLASYNKTMDSPKETTTQWSQYYAITQVQPPSPLLLEALEYISTPGKAIDIGSGALKDTKLLIEKSFDVTALDSEPLPIELTVGLDSSRFHPVMTSFASFDFPASKYCLANAMYSLPFNPPDSFNDVFARIVASLRPGGVFCGNLFGTRDQWQLDRPRMTFHTREQVMTLLSGLETLKLDEKEWDGSTAAGTPKHWHTFDFIAKK